MDFLEKFVLPQSAHHMILLKYLLVLTFILFIPYISALFGSFSLSLYFKRRTSKSSDIKYLKLSKDLIDLVTFNKGVAFVLGIVPLLSAAFCYAQLLHLTGSGVPGYILLSLLLFITALILIYIFKYTFHLKSIFEFASSQKDSAQDDLKNDIDSYSHNAAMLYNKSGILGWIFLFAATYLFIASIQFAADPSKWKSDAGIFKMIFSLNALIYYLQFIAASFAFTSSLILYKYFKLNNQDVEHKEKHSDYLKTIALIMGLASTIILPILIVIGIVSKPSVTYSFDIFGVTLIVLLILLFISNLYYVMLKESNVKFSSAAVYLFIVVISFIVLKDQLAFDTSTKKQFAVIAANYDTYRNKLNEELGIVTVTINGADIYNGKCIACHMNDVRLVGPPYKEVLPKYEGKVDELVKFILNPTKIDPEYPPMPNQGLKPNEAEAVAKYIMETYK